MLNKTKRILGFLLATLMLFSLPVMAETAKINATYDLISVRVNGSYINAPSYLYDNYVYVPLRAVSEAMGAEVLWNGETNSITITTNAAEPKAETKAFSFNEGEECYFDAYTNYVTLSIDGKELMIPHFLYNGTTYVPVSVFYDHFGCHVMQHPETWSVRIYSPDYKTFGENEVLSVNDTVYNDTQMQGISLILLGKENPDTILEYFEIEQSLLRSASFRELGEKIVSKDGYEQYCKANDIDAALTAYGEEHKQTFLDTFILPSYYVEMINTNEELVEHYVQPTDEELANYLKTTKYGQGRWLKAKHILINKTEDGTGLVLAESLVALLKEDPTQFDTLMATYSQDPGSFTQPEGYLFTEGDMVTGFYEGALPLQVGEISGIVESQYGYHIILKVADYENGVPFEEVKDEIKSTYLYDSLNNVLRNVMAETDTVLNRAVIENIEK